MRICPYLRAHEQEWHGEGAPGAPGAPQTVTCARVVPLLSIETGTYDYILERFADLGEAATGVYHVYAIGKFSGPAQVSEAYASKIVLFFALEAIGGPS